MQFTGIQLVEELHHHKNGKDDGVVLVGNALLAMCLLTVVLRPPGLLDTCAVAGSICTSFLRAIRAPLAPALVINPCVRALVARIEDRETSLNISQEKFLVERWRAAGAQATNTPMEHRRGTYVAL